MIFALARIGVAVIGTRADANAPALAVLRGYLDVVLVAALLALLLLTFVIRPFSVPSASMTPTLRVGDALLASELEYRLHRPRRGDVAVFTAPVSGDGSPFVKRVIAVPGDTLRIAGGVLYRNGSVVREPYLAEATRYDLEIANYTIYVNGSPLDTGSANIPPRSRWSAPNRVPSGCYVMLGDNRNASDDSHVWGFAQNDGRFASGPLAHSVVRAGFEARAFLVFWPLERLHPLH